MCTQAQLYMILRTIYEKSAAEFGEKLHAVILYGSYARGDYDEESDIDVMVQVKLPRAELMHYRRLFSHLGSDLGFTHNIVVSIHLQDFDTFEQFKDDLPFYRNVLRDGVPVSA